MNENDGGNGAGQSPGEVNVNLQDIIMERKTQRKQKAEEKRQVDFQRIKEMKSTTGKEPLDYFPKEIWEQIFESLNPDDRESTSRVHPLFSHLMEASRIRDILLPQVLQLDAFHRWFSERHRSVRDPIEFYKELRRISKTSRDSFDRWIDAGFEKRIKRAGTHFTAYYNDITIEFNQSSDHVLLSRLLSAFGDTKNPAKRFFSRGFTVDFTEHQMDIVIPEEGGEEILMELRRTFRNNITAALSIIGDQIWHFRFFIADEERTQLSFVEIYSLLEQLISLLPNLRWFEFSVAGLDVEEINEVAQRGEELEVFLRDHPFPHVATLERLSLHYDLDNPNPTFCQMEIFDAVIAANQQIKYLDVSDGEDAEIQGLPNQGHQIKSLVHLTSITFGHHNSMGLSLRVIEPIVNLNWQLKSIYLDLDMEETALSSLFRFLEKFPTLEDVQLSQLKRPRIGDSDTWGYLKLPNLTNLHLAVGCPVIDYDSNNHFFFSLQFLLHCAKLKNLTWLLYEFDDAKLRKHLKQHENPDKMIDFRAGLRFIYDSNIWNVFPSLMSCKVDVRKSGYETENVHLKFAKFCTHEYLRPIPNQKLSFTQFLRSHSCFQSDHGPHSCVLLAD